MKPNSALSRDIAIVGMACTYPGARNPKKFWQNIVNKVSAIVDVPPGRWDPAIFYDPQIGKEDRLYCKKGGYIPNTITVETTRFGIPPSGVDGAEPDQFALFRAVYEAVEDAGYATPGVPGRVLPHDKVSVIVGRGNYIGPGASWLMQRTVMIEVILQIARRLRPDLTPEQIASLTRLFRLGFPVLNAENAAGLIPNMATGRIANRFDLMGRNYTIDAACASSLIAVENGINGLLAGTDDLVIAGGLHLASHIPFLSVFSAMRATSLTSTIRPFDEAADGTMVGEGVGLIVLKRLADAESDGDRIYAVVRGIGTASDGKAKGLLAPREEGEEASVRRAYERCDVELESIELIEAHGTGTLVGDATEIETLRRVFGPATQGRPSIALGSVKSMIGHAMPAAGAAGLIKAALALYHKVLPPTINVNRPHPALRQPDTRLYVNSEARPWIHKKDSPRRAGVNAFGFGGINSHVILEEYRGATETSRPTMLEEWDSEVVVFEAPTKAELLARLDRIRTYIIECEGLELRDLAYTLNSSLTLHARPTGSAAIPVRLAIVASSIEELAQKIDRAKQRLADPECTQIRERQGLYYFSDPQLTTGKVAVMFPGEGAQYLNMLSDLCIHFPEVRDSFDITDSAVKDPNRRPPSAIIFPPPAFSEEEEAEAESQLWSIERATEAMLAADGAIMRLLDRLGLKPDMVTGHSAGEWIAMAAAGVLDVDEFIGSMERLFGMYQRLSADSAVPRRAMLAIGAGREQVLELAQKLECEMQIANDNCPHQVVVVLETADADRVVDFLLKNNIFVERLPYDRGYHTTAFTYICDPLREFFSSMKLGAPNMPLYCCTTARPYPKGRDEILDIVSNTFARPLVFRDMIENMYADGARIFIEAGPRGNLTAFVDDILRGRPHIAIPVDQFRRPGLLALNHATGMMSALHIPLNFDVLYRRRGARKLTLDAKADRVLPEEKRPGAVQVSVCYHLFNLPETGDYAPAREPAPEPQPSVELPPPAIAARAEHSGPASVAEKVYETAPAPYYPHDCAEPTYLEAETSYTASATATPGMLADHFALMDEFLRTQQEVMNQYLFATPESLPAGGAIVAPVGLLEYAEPAEWSDFEGGAPPGHAPVPAAEPSRRPMLAHAEVLDQTEKTMVLRTYLDTSEIPFLDDHCLYFQGSPVGNHNPLVTVMPMTGSIELMCEAATLFVEGRKVIGIRAASAVRPVKVEEGIPLPVVMSLTRLPATASGDTLVKVLMKTDGADGRPELLGEVTVVLGADFPVPPPVQPAPLVNPKAPRMSGPELYSRHHMFHGPRFHGICGLSTMAENGLSAELQILPNTTCIRGNTAPAYHIDPHLLDAAGQLVGYWPIEYLDDAFVMLPIRLAELTRFGEAPPPGTILKCEMRVQSITPRQLRADFDIIRPDGTLWLRIIGWEDWRFQWKREFYDFWRFPDKNANGRRIEVPGLTNVEISLLDFQSVGDMNGVSDLILQLMVLGRPERAAYRALAASPEKDEWLAVRSAAKDAVRSWVRRFANRDLYPVDVALESQTPSQTQGPWVAGGHWASAAPGPLYVAAGYRDGIAAAAAGPQPVALVIEPLAEGADSAGSPLVPEEREWIERLGPVPEWTARLIAAKKAAARWMNPAAEDPEFWTSLLVTHIDARSGRVSVADPGSAVNREDSLTVHTVKDKGLIFAVASQ